MDDMKLGKDVDYSQWQRKSLSTQKVMFSMPKIDEADDGRQFSPIVKRRESKSVVYRRTSTFTPSSAHADDSVFQSKETTNRDSDGHRNSLISVSSPFLKRELESACSSLCRHLPKQEKETGNLVENTENIDLIRTMKFQIKAKKQCVLEYKKQILNLMQDNVRLKKHIQGNESSCHNDVRFLLEKYHKLRGAMETITNEHSKQKSTTEKTFNDVERSTNDAIKELKRKLRDLQTELERKQNNLRTLNNYKNKEYPEKILKIKKLKKELEVLSLLQGKDLREMKQIIEAEEGKYLDRADKDMFGVLEKAAYFAYDTMNINVKDTAYQNRKLKKEIEMQRNEKAKLERENLELERKIEKLIESSKEIKTKLYPGVFKMAEICTPDTEIELSIPRKEFLPI